MPLLVLDAFLFQQFQMRVELDGNDRMTKIC